MNARQKKKLKKRDGHFHYKNYRWWQRVWELAAAKHGVEYVKAWRLETANMKGFQRNMIYIVTSPFTTNRFKSWPVNVTLLRGVYPDAQVVPPPTDKPEIDLHFAELSESTPEFASKVERYLNEWHAYMNNRKKAASSACEAMGMEAD